MALTNDLCPAAADNLQLLLENCPYPLALCDQSGSILQVGGALCAQANRSAEQLLGLQAQSALTDNPPQLLGQVSDNHWLYGWLRPLTADGNEQAALENRVLLRALEQIGLYVFVYNIHRDELRLVAPTSAPGAGNNVWRGGPELLAEYIQASEEDALYLADAFANAAFGRSASLDVRFNAAKDEQWLRLTLSPILRDDRMTGTVIGTILNVTSQKLAEQRVTRDSAFRNNVLAGISSGWELDLEGNRWAHLWNGEPSLTLLPQEKLQYDDYDTYFNSTFRSLVCPEDWDACCSVLERGTLLARFRRGEHTCSDEYRIRSRLSPNAPYEWRNVTVRLSRDPATLRPKASCHVTDISPQKAHELEAQRDRLAVEQTARKERRTHARKIQFAADTARSLHAPMRAMVGISELALMEEMSDTARDYLQQIHDFGNDLMQIFSDVLALSDTGSQSSVPTESGYTPLALLQTVKELTLVNTPDPNALSVRLEGAVPSQLFGDDMRLRQTLLNLVGSALRVSPAVELVLSSQPLDSEQVTLCATLIDRHNTLSENELDNLFVAFSTTTYGGGTGLGLSLARQLVRLMGGNLTAANAPEGGVLLQLTVPQRVIDARPIETT